MHLSINIDGAARGNPGPAAYGVVIALPDGDTVKEAGRLGATTNNIAEYTALIRALERAQQLGATTLRIRSDSELLVKQMNGVYKVKNERLRELFDKARQLTRAFQRVGIEHVFREDNSEADQLCNEVLDGLRDSDDLPMGSPPARPEPKAKRPEPPVKSLDAEAVECLRGAIAAWMHDEPDAPTPEALWSQVRAILKRHGQGHSA